MQPTHPKSSSQTSKQSLPPLNKQATRGPKKTTRRTS